jgi:hypothetical protein
MLAANTNTHTVKNIGAADLILLLPRAICWRSPQSHKPKLFPRVPDRTKVFHVKHFGTIGAQNLRTLRTAAAPCFVRLMGLFVQSQRIGDAAVITSPFLDGASKMYDS